MVEVRGLEETAAHSITAGLVDKVLEERANLGLRVPTEFFVRYQYLMPHGDASALSSKPVMITVDPLALLLGSSKTYDKLKRFGLHCKHLFPANSGVRDTEDFVLKTILGTHDLRHDENTVGAVEQWREIAAIRGVPFDEAYSNFERNRPGMRKQLEQLITRARTQVHRANLYTNLAHEIDHADFFGTLLYEESHRAGMQLVCDITTSPNIQPALLKVAGVDAVLEAQAYMLTWSKGDYSIDNLERVAGHVNSMYKDHYLKGTLESLLVKRLLSVLDNSGEITTAVAEQIRGIYHQRRNTPAARLYDVDCDRIGEPFYFVLERVLWTQQETKIILEEALNGFKLALHEDPTRIRQAWGADSVKGYIDVLANNDSKEASRAIRRGEIFAQEAAIYQRIAAAMEDGLTIEE